MTWRSLSVQVARRDQQAVSDLLFELGAAGVQEEFLPGQCPPPRQPWDTGPPPPAPAQKILLAWFEDPAEQAIHQAIAAVGTHVLWAEVPDVDWSTSWQEGFDPIVVSPTLTVAAPWNAPPGALIIEPGQGFGTGQHPSTFEALRLMEPALPGLKTCLDVGCGSGVLALLAARHGLKAMGIDVEEGAIRNAQSNAALNDLVAEFSGTDVAELPGPFDLVLGNLHAELLVRLADDLVRLTGKVLICAGILADREPMVRAVFDPALHLDERTSDGSWVALRYRVRT